MGADDIYRAVRVRMWRSGSFTRLTPIQPSGQALFLYLLTCPESTPIPGVIVSGRLAMAESLRWSPEAFDLAFQEALNEGMAKADWQARLIWLPNAIKLNRPQSLNVVKSWGNYFSLLPDCELKATIYHELKAYTEALSEAYAEAFGLAFKEAKGYPGTGTGTGTGTVGGSSTRARAGAPPSKPTNRSKTPRFTPPTVAEVAAYVEAEHLKVDPADFVDFYASKGWKVGTSAMDDWKAACRRAESWEKNERKFGEPGSKNPADRHDAFDDGGEWMYGTYRRSDYEKHKDDPEWETYIADVSLLDSETAPPFEEWKTDVAKRSRRGAA